MEVGGSTHPLPWPLVHARPPFTLLNGLTHQKKEVEEERTQAAWKALDKATGGKAGNRMDVDTVRALKLQIHALEKVRSVLLVMLE